MARVSSAAAEGVDGRLTRTLRSRLALCEACLDLVQEGVLQPSADQIAERAGLSRRSVFNHFADLAELYDAVVEAGMQRCAPLLKEIPADGSIALRLELFTDARAKFLDATAPFTRALTAQALMGPASEQALRVSQAALAQQREHVDALFHRELGTLSSADRLETLEAMAAMTSPLQWEYLRRSRGLSLARARSVMRRALRALLHEAGIAAA